MDCVKDILHNKYCFVKENYVSASGHFVKAHAAIGRNTEYLQSKEGLERNMEGTQIKLVGANNWNVWKFQTMILLRGQGLMGVDDGSIAKPEIGKVEAINAWETKDAKAQTILVTRMTEEVMLHILTCNNSTEMWRKLSSVYEQKTETSILIIQQRIFQYTYEEGIDMASFLSKIQEVHNQLKQMGEQVSEKFIITKVLISSLPEEYKYFVSAWESAPDDKHTYENLVARLMKEEEIVKEKCESQTKVTSAFVVKNKNKRNVQCYKCNKLGHYQNECLVKVKHPNNMKNNKHMLISNKKCYYCNKSGHYKSDCWFLKNKKNSNAFVVLGCESDNNKQCKYSKWLVDTGASEHMCYDKALFMSYTNVAQKSVIIRTFGATLSLMQ